LRPSSVVVTGASGYIGAELVSRLTVPNTSCQVTAIDRNSSGGHTCVCEHLLDLSKVSPRELAASLQATSTIFHLAAARSDWGLAYRDYEKDNLLATRHLIEAARIAGIRHWIYFGTVGVYGASDAPLDETGPFRPETDYARTKAEAEEQLVHTAKQEGWSVRILRPSAVYSERQPSNTNLYRLIEAIRRRRFVLIGDGSEIKTTSYLHNVVDAALWLWEDLSRGGIEAYNIVDEPRLTTRQMVDLIRDELGIHQPLLRLPFGLVERPARIFDWLAARTGRDLPITASRIRKFCTSTNFDGSRIQRAGFSPRFSSNEAIARTVAWHREKDSSK